MGQRTAKALASPTHHRSLTPDHHLLLKEKGRMQCARLSEIDWCEASGNYVRLHLGSRVFAIRRTMEQLCEQFSPYRFARISRTTMVNLDRIIEVQLTGNGEYVVLLQGGASRRLTRGYRDNFMERFFVL